MTRLGLVLAAASALLAMAVPVSASASCAREIVSIASVSGSLPSWYSPGCYTRANRLLGSDLRAYSDVPDLIAVARRRDLLRKLRIVIAKKAPANKVKIRFALAVGSIRVSIFARKHGRFVVAAIGTMRGTGGTLGAKLGKATRIRVSASYVGAGDRPVTASTTLAR